MDSGFGGVQDFGFKVLGFGLRLRFVKVFMHKI